VQAHGSAFNARFSTAISPDPLETWPKKQDVKDIKDMVRLAPDQIKKGYPPTLIIIRDDKFSFPNVIQLTFQAPTSPNIMDQYFVLYASST
jgi:hypothetical protein